MRIVSPLFLIGSILFSGLSFGATLATELNSFYIDNAEISKKDSTAKYETLEKDFSKVVTPYSRASLLTGQECSLYADEYLKLYQEGAKPYEEAKSAFSEKHLEIQNSERHMGEATSTLTNTDSIVGSGASSPQGSSDAGMTKQLDSTNAGIETSGLSVQSARMSKGLADSASIKEATSLTNASKNLAKRKEIVEDLKDCNDSNLRADNSISSIPQQDPQIQSSYDSSLESLEKEEASLSAVSSHQKTEKSLLLDGLESRISESEGSMSLAISENSAVQSTVTGVTPPPTTPSSDVPPTGAGGDTAANNPPAGGGSSGSASGGAATSGNAPSSSGATTPSSTPSFQANSPTTPTKEGFKITGTDMLMFGAAGVGGFMIAKAMKSNETKPAAKPEEKEVKKEEAAGPEPASEAVTCPANSSANAQNICVVDSPADAKCKKDEVLKQDGKCYAKEEDEEENVAIASVAPDCNALREAAGISNGSVNPMIASTTLPQECI